MDITSLGHSSFRIRGKHVVIVTDPYSERMVGLKYPKNIIAEIVTLSHDHDDHNQSSVVSGEPYVIHGPGEYEVKGTPVYGIATFHDTQKGVSRGKNTMYRFEVDGLTILHCGDLGHTLTAEILEDIGSIDILLIPVGGIYTIDAKQASVVVHEVDPSIVIPMHYGRKELNQEEFGKLQPVEEFLKEIGKQDTVPSAKLNVTKDKLPEEMQVIVLS